MATWQELSSDCLRSAKVLLDNGLLRRSISSAYYAAYCAVTSHLVAHGVDFAHGWNNPGHEQLPNLVLNNTALPRNTRSRSIKPFAACAWRGKTRIIDRQ